MQSSPGPTDMSHSALTYQAMICQRKLYELSESSQDAWEVWPAKLELLNDFKTYVESATLVTGDLVTPLHKLHKISGQKILASLQLLARRPPYRQPRNAVPSWDDFDVLEAGTKVLELHLQPNPPELEPWAWKNWVQWHALAVVLAELLVRPQQPLSDRSYAIATGAFRHYAKIVADSESGMLWKPIARLMRRVQRVRQGAFSVPDLAASNGATLFNGAFDQALATTEMPTLHDFDMFDFSNWSLDAPDTNEDSVTQADHGNGTLDDATSWLAWDSFLEDVYLPDV
jgi:hypothetical protein